MNSLFNRNIVFAILLLIVFTLVFSFLYLQLNAYATTEDPSTYNFPGMPPVESGYSENYSYNLIVYYWHNVNNEWVTVYYSSDNPYHLYDSYGITKGVKAEGATTYNKILYNGAYYNLTTDRYYETPFSEYPTDDGGVYIYSANYDVQNLTTLEYEYQDYDTYTISPGETLNFDTNYSVVDTSWDMDFDIISGTKTGSMTFYKDNDYDYADFNILMSTLGTSYDDTITVTFTENGNYTFINNTGYILEYTDDNPNITNINTTVGYYVADIGQTVYLDLSNLTGIERTLSAQSNLNQSMIMHYTEIDSTGMAVSKINDSFSTLTLKPGYEYYIMWENGEYAENSTVRFTSPVRPTYPDPIENDESYFGDYYNPVDPFKKIRIGDNENYFDIVSHSDKVGSATLDLYNAEFKVKHYKYINSVWELYDVYTVANKSEMDLQTLGIEPDIDKLEFYLQKGTADLNILRTAEEGTDYTINYQYKYFNLYEELTDETSTEYDIVKEKLRNDLGREPTNEEISQYINNNQYEDGTSFNYAEDSETALNTIKESLLVVTQMVNIMFSNPITGIFATAFGITIPIAIWKFVRG